MRVHIVTLTASPSVALGNDATGMAAALRAAGHEAFVYAADSGHDSGALPIDAYRQQGLQSKDDVLIYHHAIGWPMGERLLQLTSNQVAIRYHNVTPAGFFDEHSSLYSAICTRGQLATRRFLSANYWFWPVSQYSRHQLIADGAPAERCAVLPPFHWIERRASVAPDTSLTARIATRGAKLLCVSAFKPHKCQDFAIRILDAYRRTCDPDACLMLAGTIDERLASYVRSLRTLAGTLGLQDHVVFAENVTTGGMLALYQWADVLLSVSEHEGFGVPLIEAMHFGVPVLARATTAQPETVGDAGVVVGGDASACARAIDTICRDTERRAALVAAGRRRYETHFQTAVLDQLVARLVQDVVATRSTPRRQSA